ncbi:uncharacterized protein SPAPADRAFT_53945 [Spathaspora passalidarum NRRL Y-27907]|uniref:Uncharacterized protein n=1 Tax=Spathaspora passalidarum (strain NRRL Y-27907 / 11-Y1) TaxID=619300 RepID=G3AEV7_SPAPN|nr:uncharacterized protein SPAPADRAFT_53945 [Spathaspora passalidarum NRRL Y-27907]EGW35787.1 hypothetical protein SPAPADRAFT_53945 [Spathaspora passalidarum NRRL Y-27907]
MSRDGVYSYIHLDDSKKVLYMEQWKQESLPFDDIETHNLVEATSTLFTKLFLDDEEEEESLPIHPAVFGNKIYKSRSMLKEKVWTDLALTEKFLDESSELNKLHDKTILPSLSSEVEQQFGELSLAEFLSNGYNIPDDHLDSVLSPNLTDSIPQHHFRRHRLSHRDISLNSTSDLSVPNNSFQNIRSSSGTGNPVAPPGSLQTPRTGRVRQVSTDKNFQTPISRIMR